MFWSRIWPNNMRTASVPPGTLKLLDWKAWTECSAGAGDGFPSYSSSAISLGPDWKTYTAGIRQPAFYVLFCFLDLLMPSLSVSVPLLSLPTALFEWKSRCCASYYQWRILSAYRTVLTSLTLTLGPKWYLKMQISRITSLLKILQGIPIVLRI